MCRCASLRTAIQNCAGYGQIAGRGEACPDGLRPCSVRSLGSPLKRSTPMTMGCRKPWLVLITRWHRFTWNGYFSAGISSVIFESGIGMRLPTTSVRCCLTHEDFNLAETCALPIYSLAPLHLERLFLGRHKFSHFRVWYRDALANYIREMLLDSRTLSRPYLERDVLESIVKGHLKGNHNYTAAIHKILTLEHLHRIFID